MNHVFEEFHGSTLSDENKIVTKVADIVYMQIYSKICSTTWFIIQLEQELIFVHEKWTITQWAHDIINVYVTFYKRSKNIRMSNVRKTFQKRSENVLRTLDIGMFLERF